MEILSFFGLLFVLFLLSKLLTKHLGLLLFKLIQDHDWTVRILAVLFLPGTIVHEFAHAFIAHITGVYVGDMALLPVIEGNTIKLGSVQIAQTDPIRRFLIGVGPLIAGISLIFLIIGIFQRFGDPGNFWLVALVYYLLFQIGNGMFSSRRDMEGFAELFIAVFLVAGILYLFEIRVSFNQVLEAASRLQGFFAFGTDALFKIVFVDLLVISIAAFINFVFRREIKLR